MIHDVLQNGFGSVPWWHHVSTRMRRQTKTGQKGVRVGVPVGYNFCRRAIQPPLSVTSGKYAAKWCGPPLTILDTEHEPLCFSARSYNAIHPTHEHRSTDHDQCPYTLPYMPQSFGAVQGNGRLPPIAAAALANMSVTEQHSFEGAYAVYKTLPRGASSQPARRQIPMLELPAVSAGSAVAVLVCR
eukprot:m.1138965 g.1138965  ORF g.1138965 m.1138965 type:complete len:186 (-) comp24441_c0_seq57:1382-1939(-)